MKGLCDEIHAMGLKAGIYSTPWITSYAKYVGGSSDDPAGAWSEKLADDKFWRHGKYPFAANDARQWAAWGFDYLKYDWNPNDVPHVGGDEQGAAAVGTRHRLQPVELRPVRPGGRLGPAGQLLAHDRRHLGLLGPQRQRLALQRLGNRLHAGRAGCPFAGPGHWNDPDMLVVGHVGWGPQLHATKLTPDEQYTHISLWCLLSAPLLIGCDMERLDPFTLNLLTNDEVLALDQDALGKQAKHAAAVGAVDVFLKELEDGSKAVGFFNRGDRSRRSSSTSCHSSGLSASSTSAIYGGRRTCRMPPARWKSPFARTASVCSSSRRPIADAAWPRPTPTPILPP